MFDHRDVETAAGVGEDWNSGFDEFCFQLTSEGWAQPVEGDERVGLPDLSLIPAGPYLAAVLASVDRSRLNGFDLVNVLRARARLAAHVEANQAADIVEVSYAAPGDRDSDADRLADQFEYGSDEIRAALVLTRRNAEYQLSLATDIRERLPRLWELWDRGVVDTTRVKVISDGTAHLTRTEARDIVEEIADEAPGLTTGQLRALLRRMCLQADPEEAGKRYQRAVEARRLWIEATTDGTAHVHLYDIALTDARRIGRQINQHQINLRRGDRSGRTHDQLRADIATDLLTGDTTTAGTANINIHVDLTTLTGSNDHPGSLDGVEAIHADIARQLADRSHHTTWEYTVTNHEGRIIQVGTTRRRPTRTLSRYLTARHPTCSFPGCRMPAVDCDLDQLTAWTDGGPTTLTNTGPKCRHDHQLKDHGWTHQHQHGQDHWTSPLGHTYITQGQSP